MEISIDCTSSPAGAVGLLCSAPRIEFAVDAVGAYATESLIALAAPRLRQAFVSGVDGGTPSGGRVCEVTWLSHDENPVVRETVDAMALVAGLDTRCAERLQLIRYPQGGEYRPHFDSYDLSTERGRRCTTQRGQRIRTALLYLNDDFVGGETNFPLLKLSVRPQRGAVLAFDNCEPGTAIRDKQTLHAGAPVRNGEKWLATLWFRER